MKKNKIAIALTLAVGMTMVPAINVNAAVYNGWDQNGPYWYYYNNGTMQKGWVQYNGAWYYLKDDGIMATGWQKLSGVWYYLNSDGSMKTGWLKDNGTWYYLNADGSMKTGWLKDNGTWYYLNADGSMKTGWLKESNVKGYYLNKNGAWIENTDDLYKISTDKTEYSELDSAITVTLENNSDFDCVINADDNCLQKINKDGVWEYVDVKDRNKLGNITIKAHSTGLYTIQVDNLVDGKLQEGTYSIYNFFDGVKYERFEFKVRQPIATDYPC